MKLLLVSLAAALLPFCGFAGRFAPNPVSERRCVTASETRVMFSGGVPQFEIVTPGNAPPAAKIAAGELAEHLGKVLGCKLKVLNEKSGKKSALIVGDAALALKNVIAFQDALQGQPVGNQGAHVQPALGDKPDQAAAVHGIHTAGLENEVFAVHLVQGQALGLGIHGYHGYAGVGPGDFPGSLKGVFAPGGFNHGIADCRMVMAQHHRPPGTDIIDIGFAINIVQISAVRFFDKQWSAAHASKGANRGVHTARDQLARCAVKIFRLTHGGFLIRRKSEWLLFYVIHNKLNTRQTSGCLYWCNPDFLEYKSFVHLKHYALQRIFMERASKMPSSYLYDQ